MIAPGETPDLVSVVIPAYNAAATIDETLRSVRGQTHRQLEIIAVDDGSRDTTARIIEAHAAEDSRVSLISQRNTGVAAARNVGWRRARGDVVAFIDADELWAPTKIEKQLAALRAGGPRVGLVYTQFAYISATGLINEVKDPPTFAGEVLELMLRSNFISNGSSAMIRKSVLEEIGGFDTRTRDLGFEGCEDWLAYVRVAENHHFAVVPELLTGYRKLPGNMSGDHVRMHKAWRVTAEAIVARHPEHRALIEYGGLLYAEWLLMSAVRRLAWRYIPPLAGAFIIGPRNTAYGPPVRRVLGSLARMVIRMISRRVERAATGPRRRFAIGDPAGQPS